MALHAAKATDVATVSNFREVVVTNYHLGLEVDFDKRQIPGVAVLTFKTLNSCDCVKLDIHETLQVQGVEVKFTLQTPSVVEFETKPFTGYGSELCIKLGRTVTIDETFDVTVKYTATGGPGVCWLEPEQTAGKKLPYMYTQGQSVCNRSFFPCQDTPAVKCPYTADVTVPEGFVAVMSASKKEPVTGQSNTYHFSLPYPVQCYLIALAVGDLQCAQIGPRSKVWTEPSMLEKSKSEFDGVVEEFIQTGEKLFGPYVWETYDVLVMPPSFPYGGMENPCLTFVTPCILVGDKSLTDVIIHEISHSWFGNLVTNANWSEFWLNEGFTMYAQRRIMEEIFGEAYTCLETRTGLALLRQHIEESGQDHPLTRLRVVIEQGVDPDDTYNETPYEKGFCFVSYLQHLVGDKNKFTDFLKAYVNKYKFQSLVAEDTLEYFLEYFPELKGVDKKAGFEFESWLTKPGWPPYEPNLSAGSQLTEPAEKLAAKIAGEITEDVEEDITKWKSYQILHFLDTLLEKTSLPDGALDKMAEKYPSISHTHNAEIRLRWSQITVKHNYTADFDNITAFLHIQGKQKYTLPVYRALMKGSEDAKNLARKVFTETKGQLHVNVQNYVQKILNKT